MFMFFLQMQKIIVNLNGPTIFRIIKAKNNQLDDVMYQNNVSLSIIILQLTVTRDDKYSFLRILSFLSINSSSEQPRIVKISPYMKYKDLMHIILRPRIYNLPQILSTTHQNINTSNQVRLLKQLQFLPMKKVHLADEDIKDNRKIIVVLQKASLEVAAHKKHENVLLNGDEHANYISNKLKKDPAEYRPDITHQCLLTLMDSPLNKAGRLQVYITTATNQVIKIHPSTRIPRTYKRFAALFAQLLKRLSIRAEESSQTLLQVIKSPVKQHLPPDSIKIALQVTGRLIHASKLAQQLKTDKQIVFVVGAVAKGNPTTQVDYIQDSVCISKYALSASVCLSRLMTTYEDVFEIM